MENYDDYDSNDFHCCDSDTSYVESNDAQDHNYLVSSGYQTSDDGDGTDNIHNDDLVEVYAFVGDRLTNINSITADEIRAMEFDTVDDAYEFYYQYGKCKGFAFRKSDVRTRGSEGSKITVMRKLVCNKHGLREKKHLSMVDRKRYHIRLTRTKCKARLHVHYKANKDKYVVSVFEEPHNHDVRRRKQYLEGGG
ncbi:unnamed protein product [Vicia faba]|uniref:WRKY domain-containing protein n=1 Tax=Vicia faba TaxID=3906 RepID=A0AAV0ZSA5_VICFA|nr:unnamed protein product [Vicia faba]